MSAKSAKAVARFRIAPEEYSEGMRKLMTGQWSFWVGPLTGGMLIVAGMTEGSLFPMLLGALVLGIATASLRLIPVVRFRQSPQFLSEQTHSFAEDGIVIYADGKSARLPWDFYTIGKETRNVYLLMRTPKQANFVPKRAFTSPDDEALFRELTAARLRTEWG